MDKSAESSSALMISQTATRRSANQGNVCGCSLDGEQLLQQDRTLGRGQMCVCVPAGAGVFAALIGPACGTESL